MTEQAVAKREEQTDAGSLAESIIIKGDVSRLTPAERARYYMHVCQSVGLNPLTRPFEFINLQGKLTLYCKRDATDQLRKLHSVSVVDLTESERDGVYIVTAKVKDQSGRTDMAKGAVKIEGLKGDALANAIMKTETKAKRRATLSICGLGLLDETEIETIPAPRRSSAQAKRDGEWDAFFQELADCQTVVSLDRLREEYRANVYPTWPGAWPEEAEQEFEKRQATLTADDLGQTLSDSVGVETSPTTKADYIQWCHEQIEAAPTKDELSAWWKGESGSRKHFRLTQAECNDLKDRVTERGADLTASVADLLAAG